MSAKSPLYSVILGCWLGLLLVLGAPLLVTPNASVGFWMMQTLPLLMTLPGIIRRNPRALLWLGFLVLFYILNGVLQVASGSPALRWLGVVTLLLCLTLFTAVIVAVRSSRKIKQLVNPTE